MAVRVVMVSSPILFRKKPRTYVHLGVKQAVVQKEEGSVRLTQGDVLIELIHDESEDYALVLTRLGVGWLRFEFFD